jgi:hypothetical protein
VLFTTGLGAEQLELLRTNVQAAENTRKLLHHSMIIGGVSGIGGGGTLTDDACDTLMAIADQQMTPDEPALVRTPERMAARMRTFDGFAGWRVYTYHLRGTDASIDAAALAHHQVVWELIVRKRWRLISSNMQSRALFASTCVQLPTTILSSRAEIPCFTRSVIPGWVSSFG